MHMSPLNVSALEELASRRIDRAAWDYYRSGADDELALARNRRAWEDIELHYRVLVDVSQRTTHATILGQDLSMPVLAAPTAFHRLAHRDGELATARGVGAAGTGMILSTLSNTPIEDVVAAASGPVWFQLYVYRDRAATKALVERAVAAGVQALVLTVDAPLLGRRERDVRNAFSLPSGLSVENMLPEGYGLLPDAPLDSGLAAYFASMLDPSLSWPDLDWLASLTDLPVLVKGVVRPDDAARALDHGAAGIVVSNHGGRQLDASPATATVLPRIVDRVGEAATILVDGGIRRGSDVLKALALGADGVLVGRPVLWGLGWDGADGVERMFGMLRDELDLAMALCGCPRIQAIGRDLVAP